MTLCVAIHAGDCIYIAADSAVSYESDVPGPTGITSTGETEGTYPSIGLLVQENAWKLFPIGTGIATFAGDMATGFSVIREFSTRLNPGGSGRSHEDILLDILQNLRNIRNAQPVEVLLAFGDLRDGPLLLHGKYDNESTVVAEVPSGVATVIGSRPDLVPILGSLTRQTIRELDRESFCACLIAVLHHLAIREQLMHDGIGGSFTGAYVDERGRHWQPDIQSWRINSVQTNQPDRTIPFHAMVRDDLLVVGSAHEGTTTAAFPPGNAWENKWHDYVINYYDLMRFDYQVVTDVGINASHVFEMRKQRTSGSFRIWSEGAVARWQICDDKSAACLVADLENSEIQLVFVPYTDPIGDHSSVEDRSIMNIWHHESDPDHRRARIDLEILKPSPNETKFSEET